MKRKNVICKCICAYPFNSYANVFVPMQIAISHFGKNMQPNFAQFLNIPYHDYQIKIHNITLQVPHIAYFGLFCVYKIRSSFMTLLCNTLQRCTYVYKHDYLQSYTVIHLVFPQSYTDKHIYLHSCSRINLLHIEWRRKST